MNASFPTLFSLLFLVCCCTVDSPASGQGVPTGDLAYTAFRLGDAPLPFQAVRIRLTLANVGSKRVGRISPVDNMFDLQFKAPNDKEFRPKPRAIFFEPRDRVNAISGREDRNGRVQLFLDPGEQTSVSFCIAASWRDEQHGDRLPLEQVTPLFSEPGEYWLKCRYLPTAGSLAPLEATMVIHVHAPKDHEQEVYDLLKKDRRLTAVLMQPDDIPPADLFAKLKNLVEKYPYSSYASYARFALARCYRAGIGFSPPSARVGRALAGDELERIMLKDEKGGPPNYKKPFSLRFEFPYQPNVLLAIRAIDRIQSMNAFLTLRQDYSDSLEWLEEIAPAMTAEEWRMFRKTIPRR